MITVKSTSCNDPILTRDLKLMTPGVTFKANWKGFTDRLLFVLVKPPVSPLVAYCLTPDKDKFPEIFVTYTSLDGNFLEAIELVDIEICVKLKS